LLLAAGTPAKPRFERLSVSSSGSSSKVTYLQPAAADGLIRSGASAATANGPAPAGAAAAAAAVQRANGRDVDMLGPDNAGEAVQQRVSSKASRKRQEPEPDAAAAAAGEDAEADALEEDDDDEDIDASGEQTLGQRVANLEQQQQQQQEAGMAAAGGQQQQQQSGAAAASLPPGPVKADSLSVLLSQALRSGDRALLEQCLGVANERVIANSVKRLVPLDAALLLRAAVERLQSRPARGQQMAGWIHAVLLHHTAYLMAAPGAAPVMSSLYSIIEARLSVQRQLLSLAGRLELLLAQAGGQQAGGAGAEEVAAAAAAGPQVRGVCWRAGVWHAVLNTRCDFYLRVACISRHHRVCMTAPCRWSGGIVQPLVAWPVLVQCKCKLVWPAHQSGSAWLTLLLHAAVCVQVVYQESDSEAEVEVVDAAADYDDEDEGGFYTDEEGDDDEFGDGDSEDDEDDE
jgi:hypothetical protein